MSIKDFVKRLRNNVGWLDGRWGMEAGLDAAVSF